MKKELYDTVMPQNSQTLEMHLCSYFT